VNKIALLLTAFLIACYGAVRMTDLSSHEPWIWTDNGTEIDERLQNYKCFRQSFDDTLESLAQGEITLKAAHARIYAVARQFAPHFLFHLVRAEPGECESVRLAENIVAHIQNVVDLKPGRAARTAELKRELRELVAELRGEPSADPRQQS
jgi:hypothetical protein